MVITAAKEDVKRKWEDGWSLLVSGVKQGVDEYFF